MQMQLRSQQALPTQEYLRPGCWPFLEIGGPLHCKQRWHRGNQPREENSNAITHSVNKIFKYQVFKQNKNNKRLKIPNLTTDFYRHLSKQKKKHLKTNKNLETTNKFSLIEKVKTEISSQLLKDKIQINELVNNLDPKLNLEPENNSVELLQDQSQ